MKTNTRPYLIIVAIVAALFMLSVTSPVAAAQYKTFTGKITQEGKLMTDSGASYWLTGKDSSKIQKDVGKRVEIKGLLRKNRNTANVPGGPTIEIYSYKWLGGMEKKEMK
jgi:hypothetical protein